MHSVEPAAVLYATTACATSAAVELPPPSSPSLLNHSCQPNCIVVFSGMVFTLRVIEDIAAGEQVSLMP